MISKLFKSLSFRLQSTAVFLSFVGVAFGIKSYLHIKEVSASFGAQGKDITELFFNDLWIQIALSILVNILVGIVIYQITTKPIKKLGDAMKLIAENNTEITVPYTKEKTEIGSMARKVEVFKENAINKKELEKRQGMEAERNKKEKKEMMDNIANSFEQGVQQIITSLSSSSSQMFSSSENLEKVIKTMQTEASNINLATEEASVKINSVASASEEMTSSVNEIVTQINKATSTINEGVEKAEHANQSVENLDKVSAEIGTIINIILAITGKINLLALNASIEAARAGDAGKGFAVVANEVKNLATQTSKATEEITEKIEKIQMVAKEVHDALESISTSIFQAKEFTTIIEHTANEQSRTAKEISKNMQQAATNVSVINGNIAEVANETNYAGEASHEVLIAAKNVSGDLETLQKQTVSFMNKIKEN